MLFYVGVKNEEKNTTLYWVNDIYWKPIDKTKTHVS